MMRKVRAWQFGAVFIIVLAVFGGILRTEKTRKFLARSRITKSLLSDAIKEVGVFAEFPTEIEIPIDGKRTRAIVQYAFDPKVQDRMESLFRQYQPDYGAFVAIDAVSGRVLAMVSYVGKKSATPEHYALKASFPAASVFKMVTAAAAISEYSYSADTVIPFNGANHTLYRSNILKEHLNRWTRYITLKDAFALSVNTVFGKIGAFTVGADRLRTYADRFGFNRRIAADIPVQEGHAKIENDPWSLAESASGFTRDNTMSPLQGALMASAIVNDGVMMEPYVVESVHALDGTQVYSAEAKMANTTVDVRTAGELRRLMKETVIKGTSRGAFRGFFKGDRAELKVGGKTGSLTGKDPRGKYDWFVGYADGMGKRIAVAALTIHEKYWKVKSAYLARKAFEEIYGQSFPGAVKAK